MTKKQETRITVFKQERYDGQWPPEHGNSFIAWFQAKLNEIPEEHRGNARIELDSQSGYEGSHYASIEITYRRMETEEEAKSREAEEERSRQDAIADAEARVARLKAGARW